MFLRNAAGVNYALDIYTVAGHAIENHASMKCGALDGREQLICRGALEIPTEGDAAQIGIHENGAVAIVPGHAQQPGLPGAITLYSPAQCSDIRASTVGE